MPEASRDEGLAHVCVDMQGLFACKTAWHAPWLERILPGIERLAERFAERTVFTRFVPPSTLEETRGAWRDYYERWPEMVGDRLDGELIELVPALAHFVPPARVFDKTVYSPWWSGQLHRFLRAEGVSRLIVSGGETDVCVLATVLGAVDLGYEVILPLDALFGSADATHDAILDLYRHRFQTQLTVTDVEHLLAG